MEESGLDRLIILVSFEGKLMDRNARIKRLRLLSLERINKMASPDYSEDLKAAISKMNHSAIQDKIREVRKTFDESKCIMTYIEMNTPPPDPDSKYQGYKRKLNAEKELVKDHNRIFCEIYEMTRDAIMTFKLNFPKSVVRDYTNKEVKIAAQKMMRQGLELIMESPICDNKVNVGDDKNAERHWAEDIRDLEMSLYRPSRWEFGGNEFRDNEFRDNVKYEEYEDLRDYITRGAVDEEPDPELTLSYNCPKAMV